MKYPGLCCASPWAFESRPVGAPTATSPPSNLDCSDHVSHFANHVASSQFPQNCPADAWVGTLHGGSRTCLIQISTFSGRFRIRANTIVNARKATNQLISVFRR